MKFPVFEILILCCIGTPVFAAEAQREQFGFAVGYAEKQRINDFGQFKGGSVEITLREGWKSGGINLAYYYKDLDCQCEKDRREFYSLTGYRRFGLHTRLGGIFLGGGLGLYGHKNIDIVSNYPVTIAVEAGAYVSPIKNLGARIRYYAGAGYNDFSLKYSGVSLDIIIANF